MTKVFLLAGGRSSRIWPLSVIGDKSLLPDTNGKPIIRNIIDRLVSHSPYLAKDIVILSSTKDLSRFSHEFRDMPINYSTSQTQLGTVGHLMKAINEYPDDQYLVHYSDALVPELDYDRVDSFHENKLTILTTTVRGEYGVVDVQGRKVVHFTEKPIISTPTWIGIMLMNYDNEVKNILHQVYSLYGDADIGKHLIPEFVGRGMCDAFPYTGPFIDLGSISRYQKYIST